MPRLGVNIDHIATLRQARGTIYPDPVEGALMAEKAGADQITCHLREDRRHIQDEDLKALREKIKTRLNLEMATTQEMLSIALRVKPDQVTLVPERREEQTTEGGLNLTEPSAFLEETIQALQKQKILVSLFVNPDPEDIRKAHVLKADAVELHTGQYADSTLQQQDFYFDKLKKSAQEAQKLNLKVFAGHGLHYNNVVRLIQISEIEEYNIGHSLIAYAIFVGIDAAVKKMKTLLHS